MKLLTASEGDKTIGKKEEEEVMVMVVILSRWTFVPLGKIVRSGCSSLGRRNSFFHCSGP